MKWPHLKEMEKCASSIYSQMLHFKTCQLPGERDCVLSSSLASPIAYLASKATFSSSCTLSWMWRSLANFNNHQWMFPSHSCGQQQENYASSNKYQMLHFKTCKLPGGCVPTSLAPALACSAVWVASSSSSPFCRECEGPLPTCTSGN